VIRQSDRVFIFDNVYGTGFKGGRQKYRPGLSVYKTKNKINKKNSKELLINPLFPYASQVAYHLHPGKGFLGYEYRVSIAALSS